MTTHTKVLIEAVAQALAKRYSEAPGAPWWAWSRKAQEEFRAEAAVAVAAVHAFEEARAATAGIVK